MPPNPLNCLRTDKIDYEHIILIFLKVASHKKGKRMLSYRFENLMTPSIHDIIKISKVLHIIDDDRLQIFLTQSVFL